MNDLLATLDFAHLPAAAQALRAEVRAFLADHQPRASVAARSRSWMSFDADFSRRMAERGWVGVTLPARYGGAEFDAFARFVLVEELLSAGAPVAAHWIADRQSGPLILRYGTEAQRLAYLPRICRGEAFFCIGMSEPDAGSDLASVRSRAVRTAQGWRLNGQKVWTTHAPRCHHMIALVRTSGTPEDRQRGLSQFIIDLTLPGITIRPIRDLTGDAHFSEVFFDHVELPDDALIGGEGEGWSQVNAELAFERSGPERIYSSIVLLDHAVTCLRRGSAALAARHEATIGRLAAHLAALRHLSIAVTAQLEQGRSPVVQAALVKDLGTAFEQEIPHVLADLAAGDAELELEHELLTATAYLVQMAPTFSIRGGTRDILRGMIARGLGLR